VTTERTCKECGKHMTEGYCIDGGREYYCSDVCLHKTYTPKDYAEMHDDGEGDSYWTEWEDEDDEPTPAPTTAPVRPSRIDKVTIGFERTDGDIEVLATLNNGNEVMTEKQFIRLAGKVRDLLRAEYDDEAEIYHFYDGLDIIETGGEYHQPIDPYNPLFDDCDEDDDTTTEGGK
jgi:hypothetical protein